MAKLRRAMAALGLVFVVAALSALPAVAASPVGPSQYFTGVINGHDGNTATPIVIRMACGGPAQTGHPLRGQTLAVHQLFPPSAAAGSLGQTGNDSEIGVFFNAPPPSAGAPADGSVTFRRYDRTRRLPTSLSLPCAGTGTVWFTPVPVVPPSQSATVPVRFVNKGV
jgi:hypothetical protein